MGWRRTVRAAVLAPGDELGDGGAGDAGIIAASHLNSIAVMRQNGQRIAYSFIGYSCPSGLSRGIRTATGVVRTDAPTGVVAPNVHCSHYQMMLQDIGSSARVHQVRRADRGKRPQVRSVAKRPGFTKAKVTSKPVRVRR